MGKIRRAGFVFITWLGDHPPKHVHVYRDGRFVVKWDLERQIIMKGKLPANLRKVIRKLQKEGLI